ncbi:MAG: hypothetical protein GQ550_05975, partial [Gammaproteobacteria bacterium]|nr:hypothetical protein [Gammaproteobacteria bacterium]
VALGFGSVVAAITSRYPLLVTLSEYEGWMFGISAGLLGLTAWYIWGRKAQCPAEPELAKLCERSRVINQWVFTLAIFIIRSEHHEIFMLFVQTKIAGNSGFFSATCDGTG